MKVYIVRHAQSEENVLNLRQRTTVSQFNEMICETHTTPLTRWGRFQAQLTLARLEEAQIERLYTSPFDRALQTAAILGRHLGLEPQVEPELREVLPAQLRDRRTNASLRKMLVRSCIGMIMPGGEGEKLMESYRRAQRVWGRLTSSDAREIAIVSHYGLISLLFATLDRDRNWRVVSRDLSNGGISVVVSRP